MYAVAPPLSPTEERNPDSAELDKQKPEAIVRLMAQAELSSVMAFEKAAPEIGRVAALATALGPDLDALEVNPLIARLDGVVAVDALLHFRSGGR